MAKTLEEVKEDVKTLVLSCKSRIDLSKYKYFENGKLWTDVDQMVEDLWFELFDNAVSEACEDMLEQYEPEEEDGNGTW